MSFGKPLVFYYFEKKIFLVFKLTAVKQFESMVRSLVTFFDFAQHKGDCSTDWKKPKATTIEQPSFSENFLKVMERSKQFMAKEWTLVMALCSFYGWSQNLPNAWQSSARSMEGTRKRWTPSLFRPSQKQINMR